MHGIARSIAFGLIIIVLMFPILGTFEDGLCASQYDYQSSEIFLGNFTSLNYNVTVLNQSDAFGKGPAYLLNGVTNKGYWYQVGIGYNWSKYGTVHGVGFSRLTYLEFITSTNAVSTGNTIYSGDKILLSMYFEDNNVILTTYDWNTLAYNETTFPAFNATYFVGGPYINGSNNGTSDKSGHFTGLMTEWWHPDIDSIAEKPILYTPYRTAPNGVQLLVHNIGIIPQPTTNNFAGGLVGFTCSLDLNNLIKNSLNQTSTSGRLYNAVSYNFSPYENITLSVHDGVFVTN